MALSQASPFGGKFFKFEGLRPVAQFALRYIKRLAAVEREGVGLLATERSISAASADTKDWLQELRDWASSPMGPIESWPDVLHHVLGTIRRAGQPMLIAWGPQRIIFYNDAYAAIVAGKAHAFGHPMHEVFAEAWSSISGIFDRAAAGDSVYLEDFETPITRNGRTEASWWTLSYSPILDADSVGGVLCVVHETTRARLAEDREMAVRRELVGMTDLVPSLLWRADSFGRTVWQNGRLRALSAANQADASNIWRKLVHSEDLAAVLAELSLAKIERRPFAKTFRLKVSEGNYHWHQARSEPVFGSGGALVAWYGVATDIQDTRDALEALRDREAVFSQFCAHSANLLWMLDLKTLEIERLSENFADVWPDEASAGHPTWAALILMIHEQDRMALDAGMARAARGEVVHGHFRIVARGGDIRMFEGTTFPIFGADGRVPCLGGDFRDVTPVVRRVAHLIDPDPESQNRLSHGLRKLGFDVNTFDSVAAFSSVAAAVKPGPILYRQHSGSGDLARLSGLVRSALIGRPWLVLQDCGQTARDAVAIMKMGACDVLESDATMETIATALMTASTEAQDRKAVVQEGVGLMIYRLSHRERQILDGLVTGGTNKTIALALGLSPRTVETHRSHVMEKLGASSLAELVAIATSPSFRCLES